MDEIIEIDENGIVYRRTEKLEIDRETADELLMFLTNQYINYKYTKVHALITKLWEFVGAK